MRTKPTAGSPPDSAGTDKEIELTDAFIKNQSQLKKIVRRILHNPNDADDILQESFTKALEAGRNVVIDSPKGYLFQTARNLSFKALAKRANRLTDPMSDYHLEEIFICESQPDREIETERMLAIFLQAVKGLPAQCRKTYVLRKVYGYTHEEISTYLGISKKTVERHIVKGIVRCTEHMKSFGYTFQATKSGTMNRIAVKGASDMEQQ